MVPKYGAFAVTLYRQVIAVYRLGLSHVALVVFPLVVHILRNFRSVRNV